MVESERDIAERVIARIVEVSQAISCQAGVGGMETAGSIVSYIAEHPDQIEPLMAGNLSVLNWPMRWHMHGCLTWHGQDGKIHSPEHARRATIIRAMERGK